MVTVATNGLLPISGLSAAFLPVWVEDLRLKHGEEAHDQNRSCFYLFYYYYFGSLHECDI